MERDKMSVDSCAVDVQVGYNVEILVVETATTENMPSVEESAMYKPVQALFKSADDGDYGVMSPSETGTCTKEESKEVNTSIRIDQQDKNNVSNVALSSVLNTPDHIPKTSRTIWRSEEEKRFNDT